MIHFPELQPGVVVKITRYDGKRCASYAYVVSAETENLWAEADVVYGNLVDADRDCIEGDIFLALDEDKHWKVLSPDEIPDHVIPLVAKHVLIGSE